MQKKARVKRAAECPVYTPPQKALSVFCGGSRRNPAWGGADSGAQNAERTGQSTGSTGRAQAKHRGATRAIALGSA